MQNSIFHRLSRTLWIVIVVLVIALAAYIGAGRLLMANLGDYRSAMLQELNARVPFNVDAQRVSGHWRSFSPEIVLSGLKLSFPGNIQSPIELSQGRVSIDVLSSLRTGSIQLNHLTLNDLSLRGQLAADGKFKLTGFAGGGQDSTGWLEEFLLNVERITLNSNTLALTLPTDETRVLGLDLLLTRNSSHRRLDATLTTTAGTRIAILASGVGDPLRPYTYTGSAYVNIQTPDLGALQAMLGDGSPPFWADGEGQLDLWLTLDEGEPSVEAQLLARDLLVYSQDSKLQVPLDYLSLQAQLLRKGDNWILFASDIEALQGATELRLPRLQMDVWGLAARVRMVDVPLGPLNTIASSIDLVPENLRQIFATLAPSGQLSALQVSVGDINNPTQDWEIEANFEQVEVESFRGAPGVKTARGYAQILPTGGYVVLDSQPLTLEFPSIYSSPLKFDDVHGTMNLDWDKSVFSLSSGLVVAEGEEGAASVLFGLDVPLEKTEAGVEMQLLVGLQDSATHYRDKYIPYTLSPSLRRWLTDSIGEGEIEQGAFLWRGSLRADAAALRTVQLAFNVADTELDYHPQWPSVKVKKGTVLIDDSSVSVWSDDAVLYDSVVRNMSVELQLDEERHLILAIDGDVIGTAADGLRIVNDSALTKIVGKTFADWRATGNLKAELDLRLDLTDSSVPPQVNVLTHWQDADLKIQPGNLALDKVQGQFTYSTQHGFTADELTATLWGKPVTATLQQHHADEKRGYRAKTSELEIELQTHVEIASVQRWLNLDLLEFASGSAPADVALRIVPGKGVNLSAKSTLAGVALDLPQPYQKNLEEETDFTLAMPLAKGDLELQLALGQALKLRLRAGKGSLSAGALGVNSDPVELRENTFFIGGATELLDFDDWLRFVTQYIVKEKLSFASPQTAPVVSRFIDPAIQVTDLPADLSVFLLDDPLPKDGLLLAQDLKNDSIRIVIDRLHAQKLTLRNQEIDDIRLSLALDQSAWEVAVVTDWLQGSGTLSRTGAMSKLDIELLDIDRLSELGFAENEEADEHRLEAEAESNSVSDFELPPINVSLNNLYRGEQRIGQAAFSLRSEGDTVLAENIAGEFSGIEIQAAQPAELIWSRGDESRTQMNAVLNFADVGATLQQLGYEKILESREGKIDVDVSWSGAPQSFALAQTRGSLRVAFGEGSFLEAPSGAAGALRVVNILNLADIVGRLSLSHMFDSGIPFDSVDGEIYLHEGTLEVARMDIDGPSSFQFSGLSDVTEQTLSGEIVATLPVANNLPWVAALAASLPIAAGVFVVSKVFDKQMNRLSSAVYSVEGTWNEPQVEFDRIFDDKARNISPGVGEESLEEGLESQVENPVESVTDQDGLQSPEPSIFESSTSEP